MRFIERLIQWLIINLINLIYSIERKKLEKDIQLSEIITSVALTN